MTSLQVLAAVCGWILFFFGFFCLADGTVALISASPCWIVRLAMALVSFLLTSVVILLGKMAQLKILVTMSGWLVFIFGCLALAFGTYTRFTHFDNFKLWQWSMSLGIIAIFLTAIITFLSAKIARANE